MPIPGQLKQLRLRKGRSLQQVADAVGVSKPHIWEVEAGKSNASLDLVTKLAKYFGVSISALMGEPSAPTEMLVFGREFDSVSEEIKRHIIEMTEKLVEDTSLRMKLADLGSPELLANTIIDHYGNAFPIPVPVQVIAEAVGISEINPVKATGFEGLLITDAAKTKGIISYNSESNIARRRFTIAHEIGHFLLPFHDQRAECAKIDLGIIRSADEKRAREAEANRFAAALLLPERHFRADMRRLGRPETDHIVNLSSKYQTSKEATARKYADLSDDPCAIIFSHRGQIRSYCKSRDFPALAPSPKQPLPEGSLTGKTASSQLPVGTLSPWKEVPADVWLHTNRQLRDRTIYEQSLQQANGYRLTMLTIDSIDDDEVEEEDDLEARWTARHHRR
jgi:Zn-dependent peptidase ImmA (M78 family)